MASVAFVFAFIFLFASSALATGPGRTCPIGACRAAGVTKDPDRIKNKYIVNPPANFDPKSLCDCTCDGEGNTLFHESVKTMCNGCVDQLVSEPNTMCEEPCLANNMEDTPLHTSAAACDPVMTHDFVTKTGCEDELESTNEQGFTALCIAMNSLDDNCGGVVKLLIGGGVSCTTECNGESPLSFALANEQTNLIHSYCEVCGPMEGCP